MREITLRLFSGGRNSGFARDPEGSLEPIGIERLLSALRSFEPTSCQRLVLSGGEPTEHPDFVSLTREAQRLGFKNVALETHGRSLGRRGIATLLKRLGIHQLVVLVTGTPGLAQPGGQKVLLAQGDVMNGLRAAVAVAGVEGPDVYIAVPVIRSTVDAIEPFLSWCIDLPGRLRGFLLSLPEIHKLPVEDRCHLVPYGTQAELAARVFRTCQTHGLEFGFTEKRGIPPCAAGGLLDRFGTVFHDRFQYFQRTRRVQEAEIFQSVPVCADCSLAQSCPGIELDYANLFGTDHLSPIPIEVSSSWKLRRINRLEQFEYRNISPFKNDSPVNPRGLIRINGHCNMSCAFCFVDRTVGDFEVSSLKHEIDQMAADGTRHLVLSGGEPTLHPQLPELIQYARDLQSFDVIEMQSNGVKCADPAYAGTLAAAGLKKVTFSLHSSDPEHSDSITRLPRAFGKTVEAIHNFRALGVATQIAHVITKDNFRELPETVRFLRSEFLLGGGN